MSTVQTAELSAQLYEARAFLGSIYVQCQVCRAVAVGVAVQTAQAAVNEALEKLSGSLEMAAVKEVDRVVLNTNLEGIHS
jgi:3-deoxy-D-manno-octulosonate 8-phosphate phosphatase KdsC-like HAD superfamily phosphatase